MTNDSNLSHLHTHLQTSPSAIYWNQSPRSTVNMVTWTNWICDERNSVEGAAVWACTHTHTLHYDLYPQKNNTQHHLMSSRGTQQVSIGSTEVHVVAASNKTIITAGKIPIAPSGTVRPPRLLIGASISLLLGF
jgi:hypothetical protein